MLNEFNSLVSIVIPVYNGSNYMKEAIDSALAQTYKNIEIIVVNDGSTDNTEKIALSYGDKIRYFSKENGGVATALNLAIENANGEYISWLSHDDLYYPNKIERQIEELTKLSNQEKKNTILFSHFDVLNAKKNNLMDVPAIEDFTEDESTYKYKMLNIFFSSRLNGCTLLIPKNLFHEIDTFKKEHITIQDYILFIKFFNNGVKYKYIPEILVTSRHHQDQGTQALMSTHIKELSYLYLWAFDLFKDDFQKMPLCQFEHFLNVIKERRLDNVYSYMLSEWTNGEWNKNKPIIWLYWENQENKLTPDYIRLCWKTIINHNKYDFQIKILTEDDVLTYLPNINKNYVLLNEIAHRADYLRFNLLYEYGGIWLDSDTICFKNLKEILEKIEKYNFVYTGYNHESGKIFPLIYFLASKPNNIVCQKVIKKMNSYIDTKLMNGNQPEWDEIGGWNLAEFINDKEYNSFMYRQEYFCTYMIYERDKNDHFERDSISIQELLYKSNIFPFGQALTHSMRSEYFERLSEGQLLTQNSTIGAMFRLAYNISYNLSELKEYKRKCLFLRILYSIFRPFFKVIYGKKKVKTYFDKQFR